MHASSTRSRAADGLLATRAAALAVLCTAVFALLPPDRPALAGPGHGAEEVEMGAGAPMEDLAVKSPDGLTLRMSADPKVSTVGELTTFRLDLEETATQRGVKDVTFEIVIANTEHGFPVFRARGFAPGGTWSYQYQFFDGSTYKVDVRAIAGGGDRWKPVEGSAEVQVKAIEPPASLVARTMGLLLGVMGAGMAAGYAVRRGLGARG
ncbi:MAG: hypothetical protein HYZ53_11285 [Planctomycetes bacterium]|nr:hypothetical protein [Planctomycetota bacterium]